MGISKDMHSPPWGGAHLVHVHLVHPEVYELFKVAM